MAFCPSPFKIKSVEKHEKFSRKSEYYREYDVAIITLDCEIQFDEMVAPVCLPKEAACNDPTLYENRSATFTGFGIVTGVGTLASKLQARTYLWDGWGGLPPLGMSQTDVKERKA